MTHYDSAFYHASEAEKLSKTGNTSQQEKAKVHALLAIHYDIHLYMQLQYG